MTPHIDAANNRSYQTLNSFQTALAIIVDPRAAFRSTQAQPTYGLPLLLTLVFTTAVVLLYFSRVDLHWLGEHMLALHADGAGPESARAAEMRKAMSKEVMLTMALVFGVLGIPLFRLLEGLYYLLAGRAVGLALGYRHCFALTCWSGLPLVLVLLGSLIVLATNADGQLTMEQTNVFSLNEALLHLPPDSPWYGLASSLSLAHPWSWWIAAVGISEWGQRSMATALALSLSLWVAFYGIWALIASFST
jgi:hypothetical protein